MERADLARLLGARAAAHRAPRTVIEEIDPQRFMAAFAQAVAGDGEIFLSDPAWGTTERTQLDAILGMTKSKLRMPNFDLPTPNSALWAPSFAAGWLLIPTGGTSGRLKFARHDAATITAAVRGFTRHFALPQVNAVGVLPLHHVSGFMAWMRCVLTGGEYRPLDWKAVEAGGGPTLPVKTHGWTISLVPTQLARLLRDERAVAWLRGFRVIFLGGAPAWPQLLDQATVHRLPLSLGYGMTESAAMLSALRPEDFLAGRRSCGTTLPHAKVELGDDGVISIGGSSLFRGYYPEWREGNSFTTADSGYRDEHGHLQVTGRRDAMIITGGEKVDPVEVEAVLRGTGEFADITVLGLPHEEWGQIVVAAHPAAPAPDLAKVAAAMERLLAPAKRPKHFVPVKDWPVNAQGKVNRGEVGRMVVAVLQAGA